MEATLIPVELKNLKEPHPLRFEQLRSVLFKTGDDLVQLLFISCFQFWNEERSRCYSRSS